MKLKLGHHENLATLSLEPSAPRASNLACFKDKHLSSLSQLQMVIAAVVLRGRPGNQAAKLTLRPHLHGNVFAGIHYIMVALIWLKVMKATPYIVAVGSFAMLACVTAMPQTSSAHSSRAGSERFTVVWQ